MKPVQKMALSLLFTVIVFSGFAVLAFSGLFKLIESRFYDRRVTSQYEIDLRRALNAVESYTEKNREAFSTFITEDYVKRSFLPNQSQEDIDKRRNTLEYMKEEFPGFLFVRLIDDKGNIHFSTLEEDMAKVTPFSITYKRIGDVESTEMEAFSVFREGAGEKIFIDEPGDRLIFAFPFFDTLGIFKGSALFYVTPKDLKNTLIRNSILEAGQEFSVVDGAGFILFANLGKDDALRSEIRGNWEKPDSTLTELDANKMRLTESVSGTAYILLSGKTGNDIYVGFVLPATLFELNEYLRIILMASIFVTLFLLSFLLLSLRQDKALLLAERVKRFQLNFLKEYIENKEQIDWDRWKTEIAGRKDSIHKEIKRGIGKIPEKIVVQVDSLIDRSWDEIIGLLEQKFQPAEKQYVNQDRLTLTGKVEIENLEQIIERVLKKQPLNVTAILPEKPDKIDIGKQTPIEARGPVREEVESVEEFAEFEELEEVEELVGLDEAVKVEEALVETGLVETESTVMELEELEGPSESPAEIVEPKNISTLDELETEEEEEEPETLQEEEVEETSDVEEETPESSAEIELPMEIEAPEVNSTDVEEIPIEEPGAVEEPGENGAEELEEISDDEEIETHTRIIQLKPVKQESLEELESVTDISAESQEVVLERVSGDYSFYTPFSFGVPAAGVPAAGIQTPGITSKNKISGEKATGNRVYGTESVGNAARRFSTSALPENASIGGGVPEFLNGPGVDDVVEELPEFEELEEIPEEIVVPFDVLIKELEKKNELEVMPLQLFLESVLETDSVIEFTDGVYRIKEDTYTKEKKPSNPRLSQLAKEVLLENEESEAEAEMIRVGSIGDLFDESPDIELFNNTEAEEQNAASGPSEAPDTSAIFTGLGFNFDGYVEQYSDAGFKDMKSLMNMSRIVDAISIGILSQAKTEAALKIEYSIGLDDESRKTLKIPNIGPLFMHFLEKKNVILVRKPALNLQELNIGLSEYDWQHIGAYAFIPSCVNAAAGYLYLGLKDQDITLPALIQKLKQLG